MAICGGELLAGDFLVDCDNKPQAGLLETVYLMNFDDLDRSATTRNTPKTIMDNIALDYGKVAYKLEGVKRSNTALFSLVKKENDLDKFSHGINGTIYNVVATTLEQLNLLATGTRLVAIVERKFKGASSASAFMCLGYDAGLELATLEWNSNENGGSALITLKSVESEEEPYTPCIVFDTDYATTLAMVEAL